MNFIITDHCIAACKICCFGCRPQNSNVLDKEIIKNYIDQLAENNPEAKAAFSGGKDLMYRKMLLECMAHAKKRGLSSTLVTNYYFAGTVEKTKNILHELRENGCISIAVIADVYHKEFIQLQNVKNILNECLNMGFKILVHLMELGEDYSVLKTLETLRPEIYGSLLIIYPVFPVGAALNQNNSEKYSAPCHFCHEIFTNKDFIRAAAPFVEEEADKIRLQKLFSSLSSCAAMKDIEETLKSINFARISRIKDKMLADFFCSTSPRNNLLFKGFIF